MSVNTKVNGQLVPSAGLYRVTTPVGMADIYSTEEKEVGLWVDNKPLYQRTFDCGALPNATSKSISISSIGIDKVVGFDAVGIDTETPDIIPIPVKTPNTSSQWGVSVQCYQNSIYLDTKANMSQYNAYVTLRYTKTADTPWSGKFVPQGYGYVSSGDIYSFEERQVGVWADGKPLYQKTIDFGAIPNNTTKTVNHGIENIENIWYVDAVTNYTGIVFGGIMPIVYGGKTFRVACRETAVEIVTNESWENYTALITVRYTKTTDVAGSGEYVPSGDKAEHYSTEEEVIGTWIDGSTIYRKTVDFGALPNATSKSVAHGISNLGKCINLTGFAFNSQGTSIVLPYVTTDIRYQVGFDIESTNIIAYTLVDRTNLYAYVTLEYTKASS